MLCLITDGDKINRELWAIEYIKDWSTEETIRREYQLNQWTYHRIVVCHQVSQRVAKKVIKKFRQLNTAYYIRSKPYYQLPHDILIQLLSEMVAEETNRSSCCFL